MENLVSQSVEGITISVNKNDWTDQNTQLNVFVQFKRTLIEKLTKGIWKKYAKNIKMNGFRKGKVPKNIIEKTIGKDQLYSQVLCEAANLRFVESYPAKIIFTDGHKITEEVDGCSVTFKAWEEPIVALSDNIFNHLEFDIQDKFDTDKYIDSRLEGFVRLHPYLYNKVSDNGENLPAEDGDMVEVHVDCLANGKKFIDGCEESTNIRLIKGTVNPPEIYERLLGTKAQDSFSIITKNPPRAFERELSGKVVELHVKVNHVYRCKEAVLDDDMAITAGYKTVVEWRASLADTAEKLKQGFYEMAKKQAILTYLLKSSTITPFPPGWISIKTLELKNQDSSIKIEEVARQVSILKAVGLKLGITWDDADKPLYSRDESTYAQKVLNHLVQKAKFSYVNG